MVTLALKDVAIAPNIPPVEVVADRESLSKTSDNFWGVHMGVF